MPKILINERDRTSPGTPTAYDNYTVLIAGFAKSVAAGSDVDKKRAQLRDTNGAYEFSSTSEFEEVIGLVAPELFKGIYTALPAAYHYGNQMAYELLKIGYPIIYKVIDDCVGQLGDESFWECFKDKASYDFRFITHGLLESYSVPENNPDGSKNPDPIEEALDYKEQLEAAYKFVLNILNSSSDYNTRKGAYEHVDPDKGYPAYKDYPGLIKPASKDNAYYTFDELAPKQENDGTIANKLNETIGAAIEECEKFINQVPTTALINKANECISKIASYKAAGTGNDTYNDMTMKEIPGRGDCVALIELDEKLYTGVSTNGASVEERIIEGINNLSSNVTGEGQGKYCALTVPSVVYEMSVADGYDDNKKFPGAFHYLACFANSLNLGFAEWYAAAGYTRGVSSYSIKHTTVKLGEIAINALEPRCITDEKFGKCPKFACNVIACFRGSYYLWGNRTAEPLGKKGDKTKGDLIASSFLNIRQLCITVKKQLYVACRSFTFDPNSDILWVNFKNAIKPTLEAMKADLGIRDYKILKVPTDTKATLKAKIRIIPIEAVEDFDLEVSLEDSFGETTVVAEEVVTTE